MIPVTGRFANGPFANVSGQFVNITNIYMSTCVLTIQFNQLTPETAQHVHRKMNISGLVKST